MIVLYNSRRFARRMSALYVPSRRTWSWVVVPWLSSIFQRDITWSKDKSAMLGVATAKMSLANSRSVPHAVQALTYQQILGQPVHVRASRCSTLTKYMATDCGVWEWRHKQLVFSFERRRIDHQTAASRGKHLLSSLGSSRRQNKIFAQRYTPSAWI